MTAIDICYSLTHNSKKLVGDFKKAAAAYLKSNKIRFQKMWI